MGSYPFIAKHRNIRLANERSLSRNTENVPNISLKLHKYLVFLKFIKGFSVVDIVR